MKRGISLRKMTPADFSFADSLRALAGWNQTIEDWKRLLALSPDGCFIAQWNGTPAGTATTICYGQDLAWIGMVLVQPDFRGRGIGRALLTCCLDHLRSGESECIKLDATLQGKLLYERLGFQKEWHLTRWECQTVKIPPSQAREEVRAYTDADAEAVSVLDRAAFGASRRDFLQSLLGGGSQTLIHETNQGMAGYGTLREGARARYLGPLVVRSTSSNEPLVHSLLTPALGQIVFWDIPDANSAAVTLAKRLGFTAQRHLVRMFLGTNRCPGDPRQYYAIADPAVG